MSGKPIDEAVCAQFEWADLPWRAAVGWLRSASGSKIFEVGDHDGCITQRESELIAAAVNAYTAAQQQGQAVACGEEAAPEPFAWFAFADQNGPVPLEIYGWDRKACLYAVLMLARSEGWTGTVNGYLFHKGWSVRPVYTAPPPSVPMQQGGGDVCGCGRPGEYFDVVGRASCNKHMRCSAPPSAPVGVDSIEANDSADYIELCASRLESFGKRVMAETLRAIAAEHRALSQQPAAADEAMVDRAWVAFCENNGSARQGIRAALTAALTATQHQEPKS